MRRLALASAILFVALATVFILSIIVMPFLPQISYPVKKRQKTTLLSHHQKHLQKFILSKERAELYGWIAKKQRLNAKNAKSMPAPRPAREIVAAFYTVWQKNGLNSLRANADNITHLLPEWLHLGADGKTLVSNDWNPDLEPKNLEVERIARDHFMRIMPVLNNAEAAEFDSKRAHLLFSKPANRRAFILQLKEWLKKHRYHGINVDFENVDSEDIGSYCLFLKELKKEFTDEHLAVSVDLAAGNIEMPWREIASSCDFVILMAYDEHSAHNPAGPIASISWYNKILQKALNLIPPEKLVLGVANYAYDWKENSKRADVMTFQQALVVAQDNMPDEPPSKVIDFDSQALNPTFTYEDEEGAGHQVWILDAVTAANQWHLAQNFHIRGAALWMLGSEDPSLWTFFDKNMAHEEFSVKDLETIKFPDNVEFIGEGEILEVKTSPQNGLRVIETDEETELAVDEEFTQFPSSFVIARTGYKPGMVALTFDDGPFKPYTEEILDELKKENVQATFFVIGENATRFPGLVERMWEEGHEIGNHTFTHPNIGEVSEHRADLEIKATERAIESILGRSSILFRPPYNADADPSTPEEVEPLKIASRYGYLTVGEFIDPQDWDPVFHQATDDTVRKRTTQDIVNDVIRLLHEGHGNTILLHDGGGDRSLTVEALKILIPELKRQGYRFVTISGLLGVPRDSVMPAITKDDNKTLLGASRIVFELDYFGSLILRTAFIVAICLGISRLCLMIFLAFLRKRKEKIVTFNDSFTPSVSVLIPAYNEQKVIANTITAVLNNHYAPLDIIVIDDGSADGTADVVERLFGTTAGIRLIRQKNMGKASALNNGLKYADGEILVCLDADTILAEDAIRKLVRHFENPAVGAVAGNVKVGNRINVLTYWQAIEYITSQNLDRRAFDLLNAVPVIPGAAGAWRRTAVMDAGEYKTDTLAEDMDLTWRIRKAGYVLRNDTEALGFTEAPDTLKGLFTQRFRWTFGTLQCLWKHRDALWHYQWFGRLMLPSLWIFQILFQILAPLIDLQILVSLLAVFVTCLSRALFQQDWQPYAHAMNIFIHIGIPYLIFCAVDLAGSFSAFAMEREDKKLLPWVMVQKFVYRQLMYAVVFKSIRTAFKGIRTGWGKIERKGFDV